MGVTKRIIDKLLYRQVTCVLVRLDSGSPAAWNYSAHTFSMGKTGLDLTAEETGGNLAELADSKLTKDHPWIVAVHGRGVVYHLASEDATNTVPFADVLNARLPAVKANDFAGQRSVGKTPLYGFSKLATLEKLLTYLNDELKLEIQAVQFGIAALPVALPLLSLPNGPINLSVADQYLSLNQDEVIAIKSGTSQAAAYVPEIDGKLYTGHQLMALAAVLPYFTQQQAKTWNLTSLTEPVAKGYRSKWLAKVLGLFSLVILLLLVVVNYFVYSSLHREQQALNYQEQRSGRQIIQLDSLSQRLDNRRKLLGVDAGGSRTFSSFYADRIAASVPRDIKLIEVTLFPLIKEERGSRRNDPPKYARQQISIKGQCENGASISNWLAQLSEETWVDQVSLENNSLPNFTLLIYVTSEGI